MEEDIENAVDQLSVVTSGDALASIPVVAVSESEHDVTLTLELPSGDRFDETFSKPPVWSANCELKQLLDYAGVDPNDLDDLVGTQLPCDRTVRDTGIEFYVDLEAL